MRRHFASVIFLGLILLTFTPRAHAGIPIFWSYGGESYVKVAELPNIEDYKTSNGKYYDVGYRYKQFSLFFVPVWNYDKQWCGYIDKEQFIELTEPEVMELARASGVKLPKNVSLPFWEEWGGKLLFLSGLGVYFYISRSSKQKTTQPEQQLQVDKE